jgi:tripartite-type tricarboxylate transporter receptor subunit TctC
LHAANAGSAEHPTIQRLLAFATLAFGALLVTTAHADEYPSRQIRIIVPEVPSGASDTLARELGYHLSSSLRVPVVIENKPGASGIIANAYVAHSPPDGYTLLFATSATHVIAAQLIANLSYDPRYDFTPVINAGYVTSVIVVNSTLPVRSLADFIAYARARPGQLNYASSGIGSANHIDTEVFASIAGINLLHVPYRGSADGYRALLAGEVQLMFGSVTSALPHVQTGKLRALAVLGDHRSPLLPDVPTIAQAGLGNVDVRKWMGLLAPAGTPPDVVAKLNAALDADLHETSLGAWMEQHGYELVGGSPNAYGRTLDADFIKWSETVRRIGIHSE